MFVKIVCSAFDSVYKDKKGSYNTKYTFELGNEKITAIAQTRGKIRDISDMTEDLSRKLENSNSLSDHIKLKDYVAVKDVLTLSAEAINMLRKSDVICVEYFLGSRNRTSSGDGFRDLNTMEKDLFLKSLNGNISSNNGNDQVQYIFRPTYGNR